MKYIIQFSGGCASSFVAKWVVDTYGKENVILLFHDTKAEHPDAYRFRKQVSEFIGVPITEVSDGRSLWELIWYNHALPSHFIPFCTRMLKQEPAERF
jgi:3'-phosphoadenosine 5'-phosphosulfate sulfotransferase (PAPS reductase)/FAD synthetase